MSHLFDIVPEAQLRSAEAEGLITYALEAVKHEALRSYLFMLLDGRDPGPAILRTLEPVGNLQPREFEVE